MERKWHNKYAISFLWSFSAVTDICHYPWHCKMQSKASDWILSGDKPVNVPGFHVFKLSQFRVKIAIVGFLMLSCSLWDRPRWAELEYTRIRILLSKYSWTLFFLFHKYSTWVAIIEVLAMASQYSENWIYPLFQASQVDKSELQ